MTIISVLDKKVVVSLILVKVVISLILVKVVNPFLMLTRFKKFLFTTRISIWLCRNKNSLIFMGEVVPATFKFYRRGGRRLIQSESFLAVGTKHYVNVLKFILQKFWLIWLLRWVSLSQHEDHIIFGTNILFLSYIRRCRNFISLNFLWIVVSLIFFHLFKFSFIWRCLLLFNIFIFF